MLTKSIYRLFLFCALALVPMTGSLAEEIKNTMPSDLQCLAVGTAMAASQDKQAQSFGVVMAVYYLGRLDGSGQGKDIGKKLKAESLLLTAQELQKFDPDCRSLLGSRTKALDEINNSKGQK